MESPLGPFDIVAIDFVGPLEQSADFKYILTMIDMFTHWSIATPAVNMESVTVANILLDQLYTKFGAPRILLTDRGSNFVSHVLDTLYKNLGIDKRQTTAYHPQSNGMVERFNATVKQSLRCLCAAYPSNWATKLQGAVAAYNTSRTRPPASHHRSLSSVANFDYRPRHSQPSTSNPQALTR